MPRLFIKALIIMRAFFFYVHQINIMLSMAVDQVEGKEV